VREVRQFRRRTASAGWWRVRIAANAFLHHMVRKPGRNAGVHRESGRHPSQWAREVLAGRDRGALAAADVLQPAGFI